ncbi:lysozyme [Undibacterium curvum]|uniref:lysozyme n=1 Tax=Undibacterium curvum TaxID=2762294 RepID=UPI003D0A32C9
MTKKLATVIGASAAALVVPLVVSYEGTILHSYRDPIGIVTACTGHTGPELRMGQQFTQEQCQQMLEADLLKHASDLDCIKAPLTDGQKAAFLSFAFNVGGAKFCASTMAKKANAGDLVGACNELPRWTLAGGKELPGLVKRRAAERALCLRGML